MLGNFSMVNLDIPILVKTEQHWQTLTWRPTCVSVNVLSITHSVFLLERKMFWTEVVEQN
jgi:hypothetical protein